METPKLRLSLSLIVQLLLVIVVVPFLPLLISGRWGWWEAWVYAGVAIFGFVISRVLAARVHPDLLAERSRFMQLEDAAPWDKKLSPIVGLGGGLVLVAAGLEARWGRLVEFNLVVELAGLVVILAGYVLGSWALIANRFFSGMVRLQTDRGHHVVTGGPYRFIRHPGYAGAILTYLATPLLLSSLWSLLPAVLMSGVLVYRTALEDRFLQEKLAGYREYAGQTRYRLVPGVW